MGTQEIPLIDLRSNQGSENPTSEDFKKLSKELDNALKIGFLYLKNHGIPENVVQNAFVESRKFFKLDQTVKENYQMDPSQEIFGYIKPNQQKLDLGKSPDRRESFDFLWAFGERLRSPPNSSLSNFYSSLYELSNACLPLMFNLLKVMSLGLGLQEDILLNRVKCLRDPMTSSYSAFRTLFYPETEFLEGEPLRLAPHTDFGIFTLLFQDSVGGLEVKFDNEVDIWTGINPIPGTILMNIGNILELWSGGKYKAKLHRVSTPSSAKIFAPERQSMAFFLIPDDDASVQNLVSRKNDPILLDSVDVSTAREYVKALVEKSFGY